MVSKEFFNESQSHMILHPFYTQHCVGEIWKGWGPNFLSSHHPYIVRVALRYLALHPTFVKWVGCMCIVSGTVLNGNWVVPDWSTQVAPRWGVAAAGALNDFVCRFMRELNWTGCVRLSIAAWVRTCKSKGDKYYKLTIILSDPLFLAVCYEAIWRGVSSGGWIRGRKPTTSHG
jgi:hypothetical protein